MSKKEIDKLFQEKFEDFAGNPTEQVWNSIEYSLDKKKKNRKVIPIWWKLGGIAAVLAIGLLLINPFEEDLETNQTISNIENIENNQEKQLNESFESTPKVTNNNELLEVDANEKVTSNTSSDTQNIRTKENSNKTDELITIAGNKTNKKESSENTIQSDLAETTNASSVIQKNSEKDKALFVNSPNTEITQNTSDKDVSATESQENEIYSTSILDQQVNSVENTVTSTEVESSSKITEQNKKSIFEEIESQEIDDELVAESSKNKWSAGPSIAPVYFNAIGDGSPVHSIFVPNSKSGDINLSYGLAVSYEINKKLSIKTGIHKVDFGYNTNEVEFSSTLEGFGNGQIENIDYSTTSRNIVVESNINKSASFADSKSSEFAAQNASLNGVMAQQFGYLEIPLELNYSILNSKIGVNLIGGISSLFLIDNSITLNSGDLITEVGSANNVNNVNFSTNVGFGLNYKFTKRIQFNVEPVFKYQLNTFSQTSGDFRPFTIGVYSGLNFKF